LQTENSCRRLQSDFEKMLSAFKPEEQDHLDVGIFFHTLEGDDDGFLALDTENKERAERAITQTNPNIVVYDPLRDFSLDDLNSDKFMGETLRDILRLTKRGNPKRLPLVLHHAITGKAGTQKTIGWDRSSFGRNSKVLQIIARAVINIGPARENDNSVIIIGSGKCNNAPEFEPFAARLSFDTMLYQVEEDFDIQGWKEEVTHAKALRRSTKDVLHDVLKRSQEYDQQDIVARIIEEELVSKSTAYRIVNEGKARRILRRNKVTKTYALA
jgi:hypothetical protein